MDNNPFKPPSSSTDGNKSAASSPADSHSLVEPVLAYTANGNLEAHSVVTWLESHGVRSYAVEDNSGVSLFAFGTISQFHKPQVFVSKNDLHQAGELLRQFETQRDSRRAELDNAPPISSQCEDCGASSEFPASQDGTTQNCPKCNAFMDVGTFDWPENFDYGETDSQPTLPDNVDDAVDAASRLEKRGEWKAAMTAYQRIADRWPEHATYITNCIAEVQRKVDAAQ